jgi:hypothetical protein
MMHETRTPFSAQQVQRLGRLLLNFSDDTVDSILQHLDALTQREVRAEMDDLAMAGFSSDDRLLQEFADFLYFEPDQRPDQAAALIRKPKWPRDTPVAAADFSFQDILQLSDESLDTLLKAAPAEWTIATLNCSPAAFVQRVLQRLSPSDADHVRQRMAGTGTVDFSKMRETHQRYCRVAMDLFKKGLITR